MSLTVEERSLLAEFAGLHRAKHQFGSLGYNYPGPWEDWWDDGNRMVVTVQEWQPDQKLEQAMMLVEAIGKMPMVARMKFMMSIYEQGLDAWPDAHGDCFSRYPDPFWWFMLIADKPAAIARAALGAAKEIAEKEANS